jgi:hypothetical protein
MLEHGFLFAWIENHVFKVMVIILMIAPSFIDFDCYNRFIGNIAYPTFLSETNDFFDTRLLVFRRPFFPKCTVFKQNVQNFDGNCGKPV